jgi:hypothetical protein
MNKLIVVGKIKTIKKSTQESSDNRETVLCISMEDNNREMTEVSIHFQGNTASYISSKHEAGDKVYAEAVLVADAPIIKKSIEYPQLRIVGIYIRAIS